MADIEQDIVVILASLVGGRLYPNVIAQGSKLPAIAYQSSRDPVNTLLGPTGDSNVTMTLILVGSTLESVRELATKVRQTLAEDRTIIKVLIEEPGDQYDPETALHLYYLTYSLWEYDPALNAITFTT